MEEVAIGSIEKYFGKIGVAVVELTAELKQGDKICIESGDECFEQTVESMQVEHESVATAKKGTSVGMKVAQEVRPGAKVYKA
jgi:translation initiation factor IF-2